MLHGRILVDKVINLELSLAAFIVHVADLAEHGSFSPALVVNTNNRPHAAYIPGWVSSIQTVAIVKSDGKLQGLLWGLRPLQYFLSPIHSQKAMHFPLKKTQTFKIMVYGKNFINI